MSHSNISMDLLDEAAARIYAKELGLDTMGAERTIKARIVECLKAKGTWKPAEKKKRRNKKAVRLVAPVNNTIEVESESQNTIIEVVPEVLEVSHSFAEFSDVFEKFQQRSQRRVDQDEDELEEEVEEVEEDEEDQMDPEEIRQSKKKLRKQSRLTVAQLKQLVKKPEVVDWVDVTSPDPLLLVEIKSTRNTIPVPTHWQKKGRYLSGKGGFTKPPYELPEYIKATGIMQLRQTTRSNISVQSRARERAHPKLGRLDIDYQKLHDAFFRFQTKPAFSSHGDVYYEGREFESGLRMKKPGVLTEELKIALNIPTGAPSPWLINMQRYGPPPSYPQLQIPGLNAPIPEGAQWGFHPGGWGKPPTDELNRPLYGDVFGSHKSTIAPEFVAPIISTLWGELEEEEYESEEEEEEVEEIEEEEEEEESEDEVEQESVQFETNIETDHIELRKAPTEKKSLYTVIPQKETSSTGFMGSSHGYNFPAPKNVEISLNPEDLEGGIDDSMLKRKFEESVEKTKRNTVRENMSDLVEEHENKQSKKRSKRDIKF